MNFLNYEALKCILFERKQIHNRIKVNMGPFEKKKSFLKLEMDL